ncbi:MAG: glycosyltransferase, partial [Saprospiraceae bacterium]|nr:glycosyltransferase [Saprospiraceae bacterium]
GFIKWIFELETKRLSRYESQVLLKFNDCAIISEQDRTLLMFPQKENIKIIPNGVDIQFFKPNKDSEKKYHIVFVGNMGYHPNVKAAKYLVNEILPILQEKIPDIKILIAGARPSAEVRNLQRERVVVTGWMDDIRDAYSSAQVFVAPIFFGSGQQNKILEAMSMGLPCITTSMVNNAIGAPVETGIYVADNADSFATQIVQLLQNPDLQLKIGQASRVFVEQNYSWQHSVSILAELFEKNSQ